ncbi:MAG: TonB family protein, partial [Pseudomonadota bacterium]
ELVPALYEYANYYLDAGDFQAALPIYRRALSIQEAAFGEDDLRLVETLRGISLTYRKRNFFRGEGKRALERCVELYEADEFADVVDPADNLLELGDWHLLSNSSDKAIDAYRRAWQLLAAEDGNDERAVALLGEPYRLEYVRPLNVYLDYRQRSSLSAENFIDVTFTVSAEGKVPRARVVDGTATRRTENETLSAVRAARFRPAFIEGEPVASELTLRQYFRPR